MNMTCKTTETSDITLTIELAKTLEQWIEMAYLKRTGNGIKVESAWKLWHSMEQLSSALWDIYYNDFIDRCLLQCQSNKTSYSDDNLPF